MLRRVLRARLRACARLFASVAQELAHTLRKYFLLGTFSIQYSIIVNASRARRPNYWTIPWRNECSGRLGTNTLEE